jgi:phosphoglycolate phosphatase-like HAD superfamily hydrolase
VSGGRFGEGGVRTAMGRTGPVGFDLDLTLIDSRLAIMRSWQAVSAETGVPIDLAEVDKRMGIKLEDETAFWFPPAEQAAAAECYRRHYVVLAPDLTTLLPGAAQAVAAVRAAGERAVIITAKHPVSVQPSLAAVRLQADEVFTHVHGPEKSAVLISVGAAVYVGDSPPDMAAARQAGVAAVGVTTGSFPAAELRQAGADVTLASLADFPSWYQLFRGNRWERVTDGD